MYYKQHSIKDLAHQQQMPTLPPHQCPFLFDKNSFILLASPIKCIFRPDETITLLETTCTVIKAPSILKYCQVPDSRLFFKNMNPILSIISSQCQIQAILIFITPFDKPLLSTYYVPNLVLTGAMQMSKTKIHVVKGLRIQQWRNKIIKQLLLPEVEMT